MKDNMTVREAMKVLGITDIHMTQQEVKIIYRKLLKKWHPDAAPDGSANLYTEKTAEINAAYDVVEKAYQNGSMGPDAKDYYGSSAGNYDFNSQHRNTYNSGSSSSRSAAGGNTNGPRKGYRYTYTSSGWAWTKDPAYEEKASYTQDTSGNSRSSSSNNSTRNDNTSYSQSGFSGTNSSKAYDNTTSYNKTSYDDNTATPEEEKDSFFVALFKNIFDRSINSLVVLFAIFNILGLTGFYQAYKTGDETNTLVISYVVVTFIGFYLGFKVFKKCLEYGSIFIGGILALICAFALTNLFIKPINYLASGAFILAYLYFYGIWAAIEAKLNVPKALAAIKSDEFFDTIKGAALLIEYALLFGSSIIYLIYSIFK